MDFKSKKYIMTSEFATLKNDEIIEVALQIPDRFVLPPFKTITFETFVRVDTKNALARVIMKSSKEPDIWRPGKNFLIKFMKNVAILGAIESGATVSIEQTSDKTVRLFCSMTNTAAINEPTEVYNASQTIIAKIATFKSPFES